MNREWNGSEVMEEYARIASESGLVSTALLAPEKDVRKPVGNPNEMPATPTRNEKTEQYDVKPEGLDGDLVQKAHPKDARPADAMGDGGLVENISQQQEKDIEVARSMPHGMLLGKHAEMVKALAKLANALEENGNTKAAKRVDDTLGRVANIPFDEGLRKEAIAPLVWLIGAGIAALSGGIGASFKWGGDILSYQEDLSTDIGDLLETAKSATEDRPAMAAVSNELQSLLSPYIHKFRRPLPPSDDKAALQKYIEDVTDFQNQVLPKARSLVAGLTAAGDPWWRFGTGPQSRLQGKMKDMERSASAVMTSLQALANVGRTAIKQQEEASGTAPLPTKSPAAAPEMGGTQLATGLKGVQQLLNRRGLKVPVTGRLDETTQRALQFLEQQLEVSLALERKKGWSVKGMILKSDGTVMSPETLKELLSLADKASGR